MTDYKIILGVAATLVGFVGYAPYLRDLYLRKTKPHTFSWLIWGILEITGFFAQLAKGGGPGAWVTGASAGVAFFVAGVAFFRKDTEIKTLDWIALTGALLGILLWAITKNPLHAVILVTLSDVLAFIPTYRKSYYRPEQETLVEYGLSSVKWVLAILALRSFNLSTWLYPASLVLTNGSFVIMSIIRRKTLKQNI